MIKATFTFEKSTDKILKVNISGHAQFDDYGSDVVCASVSSLVIATVNALEEYVGIDTSVIIQNGATEFSINTDDTVKSIQAQAIANMLYMALTGLEDEHEDYIQVTVTEDKDD